MNKKGFTLVELMVVISIISILSVIGATVYSGVSRSARNAKRKADLNAIAGAIELNYATQSNCATNSMKSSGTPAGLYCPALSSWFSGAVIPTDPSLALPATSDSGYCIGAYDPTVSPPGLLPNGATTIPFADMIMNSNPLGSNTGDARCSSGLVGGYWSLHTTNTSTYPAAPYQGTIYWKLCANLEPWGTGGVYCVASKRGG